MPFGWGESQDAYQQAQDGDVNQSSFGHEALAGAASFGAFALCAPENCRACVDLVSAQYEFSKNSSSRQNAITVGIDAGNGGGGIDHNLIGLWEDVKLLRAMKINFIHLRFNRLGRR